MKNSKKALILAGIMAAAMTFSGCQTEEKTPVILAVSFGTSFDDNREETIGAVENAIREANPDYEVRRAFTSQIVIDVIKENGGKVTKKENWGLRTLAYRMNKNRKGYYVLFNIDAPAEAVIEMERQMRFDEDVIRYLSVRVDALDDAPSAVLSYKGKDAKGRKKFDDKFDVEDESEEF